MSGWEGDEEEENMSVIIGSSIFKVGMGTMCYIKDTQCIHAAIVIAVSTLLTEGVYVEFI